MSVAQDCKDIPVSLKPTNLDILHVLEGFSHIWSNGSQTIPLRDSFHRSFAFFLEDLPWQDDVNSQFPSIQGNGRQ